VPRYTETPFRQIIESFGNEPGLTPAEIEELTEKNCRIAAAGMYVRNDRWSDLLEAPEPAPYSHFEQPPDWFIPDDESLRSTLERLAREDAMAVEAAKAAK